MERSTAVVLAGGSQDEVTALAPGAPNKAFVKVAGVPLVTRTLQALKRSAHVGRIVAVAPPSAHGDRALSLADEIRPSGLRISDSLRSGLAGLDPDAMTVLCTSDLPLLTEAAVDEFIGFAVATGADVTYGCLERRYHEARFPQFPHTWAHLRGGTFCGTGLMTVRPRVYPLLERFIERLGAARKNPLRLASLFGWDVMLALAARRLTIAAAERRAGELLGASVRAVPCTHPEIAINVDRASDVALAEAAIAVMERNAASTNA
ncbi:MAG: nucleotidyltransferase family protein [Candidatus Eremiobacteraeota bacterium]|nr:nucleotidyltransferase family protein [Candidatus Eremiobacteraeota bacterium]